MSTPTLFPTTDPDARSQDASVAPRVTKSFLIFRLGDGWYAVGVGAVSEVVTLGEVTPVPFAPHLVKGVMQQGGRIVVVLDGAALWGSEGAGAAAAASLDYSPRCVLLRAGEALFATTVDELGGVVDVAVAELSQSGFALGERLVSVVDPQSALAGAESHVKEVSR